MSRNTFDAFLRFTLYLNSVLFTRYLKQKFLRPSDILDKIQARPDIFERYEGGEGDCEYFYALSELLPIKDLTRDLRKRRNMMVSFLRIDLH